MQKRLSLLTMSPVRDGAAGSMIEGRSHGDWHGKMVQRNEGVWFYPARRRQRGRLRPHFRGGAGWPAWSRRRPEDHLRAGKGSQVRQDVGGQPAGFSLIAMR